MKKRAHACLIPFCGALLALILLFLLNPDDASLKAAPEDYSVPLDEVATIFYAYDPADPEHSRAFNLMLFDDAAYSEFSAWIREKAGGILYSDCSEEAMLITSDFFRRIALGLPAKLRSIHWSPLHCPPTAYDVNYDPKSGFTFDMLKFPENSERGMFYTMRSSCSPFVVQLSASYTSDTFPLPLKQQAPVRFILDDIDRNGILGVTIKHVTSTEYIRVYIHIPAEMRDFVLSLENEFIRAEQFAADEQA